MGASGNEYLNDYYDGPLFRQYLVAMYWAMTTMTTVGYGDITPGTDWERVYTIFAMIVGGGFYGYVIGSITSIISGLDANMVAHQQRLDLIQAWIDHHKELPRTMS